VSDSRSQFPGDYENVVLTPLEKSSRDLLFSTFREKKRRGKKRKEKKNYASHYAARAPRVAALTRLAVDSRNSLPFSASFAVDFIRHCETRCNAVGCPFSLSLSLPPSLCFCFFYSAHQARSRAPMQTRKLDRIPGIIRYLKRKVPTANDQFYITGTAKLSKKRLFANIRAFPNARVILSVTRTG